MPNMIEDNELVPYVVNVATTGKGNKPAKAMTHEAYINAVVAAARKMIKVRIVSAQNMLNLSKSDELKAFYKAQVTEERAKLEKLEKIKVVYGLGAPGLRGMTVYEQWLANNEKHTLVEVCAFGQQNWTQVAGTTVHELAHVVAGPSAGHGKEWKVACEELGLVNAVVHMEYKPENFSPALASAIERIPLPTDGSPIAIANRLGIVPSATKGRICGMGIGTRGGKSRGVGSGSRLIKCACPECGYTVRTTQKWIDVAAPTCPVHNVTMTVYND